MAIFVNLECETPHETEGISVVTPDPDFGDGTTMRIQNLRAGDWVRFKLTLAQAQRLRAELTREIGEELELATAAAELGIDLNPSEPGAPGNDEPDERHEYQA